MNSGAGGAPISATNILEYCSLSTHLCCHALVLNLIVFLKGFEVSKLASFMSEGRTSYSLERGVGVCPCSGAAAPEEAKKVKKVNFEEILLGKGSEEVAGEEVYSENTKTGKV